LSFGRASVPGLGKERLKALTDGIFATVMTVLVLSLSIPAIAPGATNGDVAGVLGMLLPNIVSYVLGFKERRLRYFIFAWVRDTRQVAGTG
jgi:uncharacterized membrane protein